ncbi:MAG: basic amino acid ABC transporter substrate-binding protein [Actinomycetota bacterium]|nr:basic amino acid ABC transporter substrate-binding protein [Actinomycetota bacterium]
MKNFRGFVLLALSLALSLSLAACGGGGGGGQQEGGQQEEEGQQEGGETLTIASDIAYRPFEFVEGGEPVGFDLDLMREIGNRVGFEPRFQNTTFDGIIPGLTSGTFEMAISAMTITEEREQQVDFSDPYFDADQSLLVQADSEIRSTDDLADATVGVQLGTTGAMEANNLAGENKVGDVRTFDTVEDAFTALENGQVDAVLNDFPVSQDRVLQSDGAVEIVQTIPTGEQYGIAFPTDSPRVEEVNRALAEIKQDGTYARIYEKWFGRQPESIPGVSGGITTGSTMGGTTMGGSTTSGSN